MHKQLDETDENKYASELKIVHPVSFFSNKKLHDGEQFAELETLMNFIN